MSYLKYLLESNTTPFSLPKGVSSDLFTITSNLENADKWQVKILEGNSISEGKKVGDWDEVGYIMISLKDNTIIPIARSDEHHRGYDLLSDFYHLSSKDYYSLWIYGKNYPYTLEDFNNLIIALEKVRSYGVVFDEEKPLICFYYLKNYYPEKFKNYPDYMSAKDYFENYHGNQEIKEEISELGKELVKAFEDLAHAFEKNIPDIKAAIRNLYRVGKKITFNNYPFISPVEYEEMIEAVEFEDNIDKLWEIFFSFNGWRNKFHQRLRRNKYNKELIEQLGSVEEVIQLLSNI